MLQIIAFCDNINLSLEYVDNIICFLTGFIYYKLIIP